MSKEKLCKEHQKNVDRAEILQESMRTLRWRQRFRRERFYTDAKIASALLTTVHAVVHAVVLRVNTAAVVGSERVRRQEIGVKGLSTFIAQEGPGRKQKREEKQKSVIEDAQVSLDTQLLKICVTYNIVNAFRTLLLYVRYFSTCVFSTLSPPTCPEGKRVSHRHFCKDGVLLQCLCVQHVRSVGIQHETMPPSLYAREVLPHRILHTAVLACSATTAQSSLLPFHVCSRWCLNAIEFTLLNRSVKVEEGSFYQREFKIID